jgi:LysR family transcriptional activator of nhaA
VKFCKIHLLNCFNHKNRTMKLDQLNFHHLLYFWRVARSGHLTRAAQELHTSQSALSAQIRQLEDRLGEPLFNARRPAPGADRHGPAGALLRREHLWPGPGDAGPPAGTWPGTTRLRVGSVATLSRNYQENWIRPLLADPSVTLTLESGPLEGLLIRLTQHQLDVVLANEAVPADPERPLHCRFLGSQAISLVGPRRPLGRPQPARAGRLARPGHRPARPAPRRAGAV